MAQNLPFAEYAIEIYFLEILILWSITWTEFCIQTMENICELIK